MRFNLKRPCKHCPFRVDIPGYLTAARARGIIDTLLSDDWEWFACHETTETDEDASGERFLTDETEQCVGSLILLLKLEEINVPSRLAAAVGKLDLDKIDMQAPVAESREQFIAHHTRSTRP